MNKEVSLENIFHIIEEQLDSGGNAVFTIHGTSMLPLLCDRKDSVRLVKPTTAPKKYDIIFYKRQDGSYILHRIVAVKKRSFVCRGDNQVDNEYPVSPESVIAIVSEYNRKGKWKSVDSLSHIIYSRFWVNTMILRKIKRKVFSIFKK